MKLVLRDTKSEELACLCNLEQGAAREFIMPYSLELHLAEFAKPAVRYKSIWADDELVGFVLLVLDSDGRSVEFRRIVISKPGMGYGKAAVGMINDICRRELGRNRVWLDVFESNHRARHLYEQCGYRLFGKSRHEGRSLLLYERAI